MKYIGKYLSAEIPLTRDCRYLIYCARRVSGINFIRYANVQKIGKSIQIKASKPRGLNRINKNPLRLPMPESD
jgi:6-phosphogluconolactonase (cycloisomerase 2 family)